MSIATVITDGYGSFSAAHFVITEGFTASSGTIIFIDYGAASEWLSQSRADDINDMETSAAFRADRLVPMEDLAAIRLDALDSSEWLSGVRDDSNLPDESLSSQRRDLLSSEEWLAAVLLSISVAPVEYLSVARLDAGHPIAWGTASTIDLQAINERLANARLDQSIPLEDLALTVVVSLDYPLGVEWLGIARNDNSITEEKLSSLRLDNVLPGEMLVVTQSAANVPIEWLGSSQLFSVSVTWNTPVEWLSTDNLSAAAGQEWEGLSSLASPISVEWQSVTPIITAAPSLRRTEYAPRISRVIRFPP